MCFISAFCDRYNNPIGIPETKDSPFKNLPYNFLTVFGNFMEIENLACYAQIGYKYDSMKGETE